MTQEMWEKDVDTFLSVFMHVSNCYRAQKMCESHCVPNCFKTQEMCKKSVSKEPFMLKYCIDKYLFIYLFIYLFTTTFTVGLQC